MDAVSTEAPHLEDTILQTDAGRVAAFYMKMLGRMPTPEEAAERLYEEIDEFLEAFDFSVDGTRLDEGCCGGDDCPCGINEPASHPESVLGEMADVIITLNGYALSKGWNLAGAVRAVMDKNMTKSPNIGGTGKIQKPDDFVPADLSAYV